MVAAVCLAFMMQSAVEIDPTGCQGWRQIRLQIIPVAAITSSALGTLVNEAAAIWRPYGVTVAGTQELTRPDHHDDEEWITLIISDASAPRALASLTFVNGAPGDVMYASPSMARHMLKGTRLDRLSPAERDVVTARLLGRAVAHEVGHYVLRSREHSGHGLMRVAFGVRDLVSSGQDNFRLESIQEVAVRGQGGSGINELPECVPSWRVSPGSSSSLPLRPPSSPKAPAVAF